MFTYTTSMKHLIIVLSLLLFCSCASTQKRAQRHLHKAIRLDSTIVGSLVTDTTLKGVATGAVKIADPGFIVVTNTFDCDSIRHLLDSLASTNKAKGYDTGASVPIYEDNGIRIDAKQDKDGKMSAAATVKPKEIKAIVSVPYSQQVKLKSTTITIREEYACWHYWWFWLMVAIIVLLIIILIRRR